MKSPAVTIIDGGGANIASLVFALKRLGADSELTRDPARIRDANRLILPGVGAAAEAMQRLCDAGLDDVIPGLAQPVLGICLGMQLLASGSEENDASCLGIVDAGARLLHASPQTPVPNMGWCPVRKISPHPLLDGIDDGSYFYFVHSYALPLDRYSVAGAAHVEPFAAVLAHRNFMATQFHPERSSSAGSRVLKNFLGIGV